MDHAPAASASPAPSGAPSVDHDANAEAVVKRFLDGEAPPSRKATSRSSPRIDGDTKVFELTIDPIEHQIDAQKDPDRRARVQRHVAGPAADRRRGRQGPRDLQEQHGRVDRDPLPRPAVCRTRWTACRTSPRPRSCPVRRFTYEFVARTTGSHMYHSHHNATDQVGRGLLGAFIVEPKDAAERYDRLYGATQDIVWISNDVLGGFTINGRGFPATAPIVAKLGDTIVIRFMNEGTMMHPWHLHGMPMRVVARDGYPLGPRRVHLRHAGRQPRRALGRRHRMRRARGLGVPLPHPARTRRGWTDVRHGHGARRRGSGGERRRRRRGGLDDGDAIRLSDPDHRMSASVDAEQRKIASCVGACRTVSSATRPCRRRGRALT